MKMFQRIFRGSFSPIFQWGYWATSGELANLCLWGWQHRWCPPLGGTARQVAGHCSQNEWKAGPQVPSLMEPHVRKPSTNPNLLKSALLYYLKSIFLNSTSWFFSYNLLVAFFQVKIQFSILFEAYIVHTASTTIRLIFIIRGHS